MSLMTPTTELLIKEALKEDIGRRDLTSDSLIPTKSISKADCLFKQDGVLAGIEVAEQVFRHVDPEVRFLPVAKDGEKIEAGREVFYAEGSSRSILAAERVTLNFLSRLSGIATLTRSFVDKVSGYQAKIMDTRKTMPGYRVLERYAVRMGGGVNHRQGLFDQILIKDNHLKVMKDTPLLTLVKRARLGALKNTVIGVEVKTRQELKEALATTCQYILLDNMNVEQVAEAVKLRNEKKSPHILEVSGNVTIDNAADYAKTGVDRISVGRLTHSVPAIDISLEIVG